MFQKKDIEMNFDIIIGPNSTVKGDLESDGSIRIDGVILGDISSKGNIIISEQAKVTGNVACLSTEIYGVCKGNVSVQGRVNLHENASLDGDVIARSFNTKEGAHFTGNCTIDSQDAEEPRLISLSKEKEDASDQKQA
ncbi:bactofilin family protein [Fusibacter sp. JL298sf-3]